MLENKTGRVVYKEQPEIQAKQIDASLISKERSQRLDLLIHLISNLNRSIVICGAKGIGKTIFLNELKKRQKSAWYFVSIETSSDLSLNLVQDQLIQLLIQCHTELKNYELPAILAALESKKQKIIVIFDDAGILVPGLINQLIQYASNYSCLRILFSFTHDELFIKGATDNSLNDCSIVEIPPLNIHQSGIFLQNLSGRPDSVISFNAINDVFIEQIYQKTHGIPGKIIKEVSSLHNYKVVTSFNWYSLALLAAIVGIAIHLINSDQNNLDEVNPSIVSELNINSEDVGSESIKTNTNFEEVVIENLSKEAEKSIIDSVDIKLAIALEPETDSVLIDDEAEGDLQVSEEIALDYHVNNVELNNSIVKAEQKVEKEKALNHLAIDHPRQIKTNDLKKTKEIIKETKLLKTDAKSTFSDASQWILEQPDNSYTIQLIVYSKRRLVDDFIDKNIKLKENIRYFKRVIKDKEQYVLIYGSFVNKSAANKAMKIMPGDLKKSWLRKFKILKKIIKK